MEIHPTPDQDAFIRLAIESERLHTAEDAVQQALAMWEERERRRLEYLAVDKANASIPRGEGHSIATREEVMQLAEDIKQRGMARLAAFSTGLPRLSLAFSQ